MLWIIGIFSRKRWGLPLSCHISFSDAAVSNFLVMIFITDFQWHSQRACCFSLQIEKRENIPGTHQVSKKCIFSSHSALANTFLNTTYFAVQCLKTKMSSWRKCMICESCSSGGTVGRIWGVFFSVLIAQGCITLSNQKSLPVCAALIHAAFHTYPPFGPSGQDGSLMDHIPEISW